MTIKGGFIVDVSSFCDRWCSRCPFTARCELYAKNDAGREETTRLSRASLLEQVQMMHALPDARGSAPPSGPAASLEDCKLPAGLEASHGPDPEVVRNTAALHRKHNRARLSANASVRMAIETIENFSLFVPVKMFLCIGTVSQHGVGPQQSDANGWGKAAMLGLDRMTAAWQLLVDTHHYTASDVAPFLSEIARMRRNLDRTVPNARAFVRPGFDDKEELALSDPKLRRH